MSEETKTQEPILPVVSVERNGVTVTFSEGTKKRGTNPGEPFYAYPVSLTLAEIVKHFGEEESKGILIARGNIYAQKWLAEATSNEDGTPKPLDVEEFKKYATEFSARGLTSAQLTEEISARTDELQALVMDLEFNLKTKEERLEVIKPMIERINGLKSAVAARKRKKEDEDKGSE